VRLTRPDGGEDLALVDVAFLAGDHVGNLMPFEPARLRELVLARAEPAGIGMSPIGGLLRPVGAAEDAGLIVCCAPPGAHDIQYCRSLGYWATRFLLEGGSNAMVTIQAGRLVPIPFGLMLDPKTGKVRVRYVDVESEMYQTLAAYMIRLKAEDFDTPESLAALAKAGNLSETELLARFGPLVGRGR